MKELIKITQHNGNSFISARELHKFLEVGKMSVLNNLDSLKIKTM